MSQPPSPPPLRLVAPVVSAVSLLVLSGSGLAASPPPPDRSAERAADPPETRISPEEVERLRALAYTDVGTPLAEDQETGVTRYDPERSAPGLNVFTSAHVCETEIMDMEGRVRHSWSGSQCFRWGNGIVLPDGDLLVVGRTPFDRSNAREGMDSRYVMRQTWDGEVRWKRHITAHHDVGETPDGRALVLTYRHEVIPTLHPTVPLQDQVITVLGRGGKTLRQVSLYEVLESSPAIFRVDPTPPRHFDGIDEIDALHVNTVEWVRRTPRRGKRSLYDKGNVLICARNQDSVAIFRWKTGKLIWTWGRGVVSGPHDATMLANGNLLIFDNGLNRGWSRVIEMNPLTGKIVWEYHAPRRKDFYTRIRGSNQKLSNGNVLICESGKGRAFEVTPDRDIVWEFINPNVTVKRRPSAIVRMRRYEGMTFPELRAEEKAGTLPRVD